jgi:hypothetical protein
MDKNQSNLKKKIDDAMVNSASKQKKSSENNDPFSETKWEDKVNQKKKNKPFIFFGSICLILGIVGISLANTATVDESETAKNALQNKMSTGVSAGVILLSSDENIGAQDYTITHSSPEKDTKIWVWDYAAEDGDYVQVLIDGKAISEPFMIKHKPKVFTVPSVGTIQVKGIKDGGGGITYAVRYELNSTSYFNSAPEGEFNTYELVK